MNTIDDFVLTFDIDWAPDFVIDYVADILIEHNVKATWFVTHHSISIQKLFDYPELFELGIHPNMLKGSTHGNSEDEVLNYIKSIVPNAVSMRTHGLYQTSNFLIKSAKEFGILYDVSLFLPKTPFIQPHCINYNGAKLHRIPYFWADDMEMFEDSPNWGISDYLSMRGLKVFDFHPIHIALNTEKFEKYDMLKKDKRVNTWDEDFIKSNANNGNGPRDTFLELVSILSGKGKQVKDIIRY